MNKLDVVLGWIKKDPSMLKLSELSKSIVDYVKFYSQEEKEDVLPPDYCFYQRPYFSVASKEYPWLTEINIPELASGSEDLIIRIEELENYFRTDREFSYMTPYFSQAISCKTKYSSYHEIDIFDFFICNEIEIPVIFNNYQDLKEHQDLLDELRRYVKESLELRYKVLKNVKILINFMKSNHDIKIGDYKKYLLG